MLGPSVGRGRQRPHGVPIRRRATCGAANVPRMDPTSPAWRMACVTPFDSRLFLLSTLRRVLRVHGSPGSLLCPIDAQVGQHHRPKQRQKGWRFAGFQVGATIVASVCMLSLLSVAVGAKGLSQAPGRVARLARLLAEGTQAVCRESSE